MPLSLAFHVYYFACHAFAADFRHYAYAMMLLMRYYADTLAVISRYACHAITLIFHYYAADAFDIFRYYFSLIDADDTLSMLFAAIAFSLIFFSAIIFASSHF